MLANVGYKSGKQLVLELLHTAASAAACPTRLLQLFLEGTAPGLRAVNTPNAIELENHKPSHCTDWDIKESLASNSSSSLWQSLGWYGAELAPATKTCTAAVDGHCATLRGKICALAGLGLRSERPVLEGLGHFGHLHKHVVMPCRTKLRTHCRTPMRTINL